MELSNAAQLRQTLASGPYAWPGGYPIHFVMGDGAPVCFSCAQRYRGYMAAALGDKRHGRNTHISGAEYLPVAVEINWEDDEAVCAGCGQRIEVAYGNDETTAAAE